MKKSIITVVAVFALSALLSGCGNDFATENTTEYVISSDKDLREFAKAVSDGNDFAGKIVVLDRDISLKNKKYVPAGLDKKDNITAFAGIFDGKGYSISNINIDSKNAGLFAELSGTVLNLTIESGKISGENNIGGICGKLNSNGSILNSYVGASVCGDKEMTGGLAGVSEGTIINCVYYPKDIDYENADDANRLLIGLNSDDYEENCYMSFGDGWYELKNGSHPQNNIEIYERACTGLNNRLCPLKSEYPDFEFNAWELGEDSMSVNLSDSFVDSIKSVSATDKDGQEYELEYLADIHCFGQREKHIDFCAVSYETYAGNIGQVESDAEKIVIDSGYGESLICVNELQKVNQKGTINTNNPIDLSVNTIEYDGIDIITTEYFDENNNSTDKEKTITVGMPGKVEFSGDLNGMIVVDLSKDNEQGIDIVLNNANITSKHNVGICIASAPDSEDPEEPLVNVITAKDSENSIIASNNFDLFVCDNKIEGAISTPVSIGLKGEGSLYIEGDIEGIESKDSILIAGGDVDLNTCDDCIASKAEFILDGGRVHMLAKDNNVDCDSVYLNGGVITGSSLYRDERFIKKKVRSNGANLAGCIGLKDSQTAAYEDESVFPPVTICFEEPIKKDAIILMADENDNGIIAVQNESDGESFCAIFSTPFVNSEIVHFYICDRVDGDWYKSECINITGYNAISEIVNKEDDGFSISKISNQLVDVEIK